MHIFYAFVICFTTYMNINFNIYIHTYIYCKNKYTKKASVISFWKQNINVYLVYIFIVSKFQYTVAQIHIYL